MSTPWPSLWSRPGEADDDAALSAHLPAASATAHLRPPLPPAALYGLAGDVALALSKESGADPAGIFSFSSQCSPTLSAPSLMWCSASTGRQRGYSS